MDFYLGERVRCLGKAEWGTGFVKSNSKDGKVLVHFTLAGNKLLSIRHAKLMKVKPPRPRQQKSRLNSPPVKWLRPRLKNTEKRLPALFNSGSHLHNQLSDHYHPT